MRRFALSNFQISVLAVLASVALHIAGMVFLSFAAEHMGGPVQIVFGSWRPDQKKVEIEVQPPPPTLPPEEKTEPIDQDAFDPGDAFGLGESINSSIERDGAQRAPDPSEANQAALTRDNEGNPNRQPRPTRPRATPPMEALAALAEVRPFRPPAQATPIDRSIIGQSAKSAPKEIKSETPADTADKPVELARAEEAIIAPPQVDRRPEVPSEQSQPQPPAGMPGAPTDRDSDLVADEFALTYERGRVNASKGREFKFARPRENLAALVEATTLPRPLQLNLKIEIDDQGNVKRVTVVRSTGSSSLDRILELAAYRSWFQPRTDASGRTLRREEFTFPITIQ
jgi:hypothetical protein